MKIITNFSEFKSALNKVEKLNTNKETLLVLKDLYLKTNERKQIVSLIKRTEKTIVKVEIPCEVEETGDIIIPCNIVNILKKIKDTNKEITITNNSIIIGNKKIKFFEVDLNNYPQFENYSLVKKIEVTQKELLRLLTCSYAIADDDTRPSFEGVNVKNNDFVALNGYILSKRHSKEFESDVNVIINKETVKLLNTLLDKNSENKAIISINAGNKAYKENTYISIKFQNVEIQSKLIDEEFLNYNSVIPELLDATTIVQINDDEFENNLKLFKELHKGKEIQCKVDKMYIKKDKIKITSSNEENTIECDIKYSKFKGEELNIAFNNDYAMLTTKQYDGNFKCYMTRNVSPIVITDIDNSNDGNLELLLPVRCINW